MSSLNIYNSHLQLTFVHCKLIITQISEYATPKLTFVQICESRIKRYKMFYTNLQKICAERDTNVTQALKDIGHSDVLAVGKGVPSPLWPSPLIWLNTFMFRLTN